MNLRSVAVAALGMLAAACSDDNRSIGTTPTRRAVLTGPTVQRYAYRMKNGKPAAFRDRVKGTFVKGKCVIDTQTPRHGTMRPFISEYDPQACEAIVDYGDWDRPDAQMRAAPAH